MKHIITASTVFVIIVALLTIYYRKSEDELQSRLKSVLSGLITIEKQYEVHFPRVAVGYGACKDIAFKATDVLDYRDVKSDKINQEIITSYDDLLSSFAYYFAHGAAAEVSKLRQKRVTIGGNAASIARRFSLQGFNVLLASTMTPTMRNLFPQDVKVIGEESEKDDIHLVFEYKSQEHWGPYKAPRANRFILHHDYHNPQVSCLENFDSYLKNFRADLFVVSGLQMMDNFPMSTRIKEDRLKAVSEQMKSQSHKTKIHFEMASITENDLLSKIFHYIIPFSDSLGMNEQELANLHSSLIHNVITLATDSNPRISKVLDTMRQVFSFLQETRNSTYLSRPLTRLHVHTLAYQLIMVSKDSNWKNTYVAAAKASLLANTYVCDTPEVDIEKSTLVVDESFSVSSNPNSRRIYLDDKNPVACWDESFYHICLAPNLVCTSAKQTAGCGDNISAAGLAAQI